MLVGWPAGTRVAAWVAVALLLGSACGGGAGGGGGGTSPVRVGVWLPLTGPAAELGSSFLVGEQIAAKELNDRGGILGRPVELVIRDDAGNVAKAAQVGRDLVDREDVDFVIGSASSSSIGVELPIVTKAGKITVVQGLLPEAGDARRHPYVFRTEVVADVKGVQYVTYLRAHGLRRAGAVASNDALGRANVDGFRAALAGSGVDLVAVEFHEVGQADQTAQVRKLRDAGADVLLMFNVAIPDQVGSIRARNEIGWKAPVLGSSALVIPGVSGAVGAAGLEGVLAGNSYRNFVRGPDGAVNERAGKFVAAYRARLGVERLDKEAAIAAGGYDSLMMIAQAAEAVGELDPRRIKAHLERHGHDGVKASYTYDEARHDGVGTDDLVFVLAGSLRDGFTDLAPGETLR